MQCVGYGSDCGILGKTVLCKFLVEKIGICEPPSLKNVSE
jgi:hypothetical protein